MNLFDLVAKITLDSSGYERGLQDAEKKTSSFAGKLKAGFATAGKIAAAGIAIAGGAAVAVGKQALESYANYEQLVGGVETLFKDSAGIVQEYASKAYETAGLSANQYMETVTSFSASLLQSLDGDTEKAAAAADRAIIDMSDNANKMGTSMESIQYAYQGFAKQNYTMLDNLKLGYGGTKEEMARLIKDASKMIDVQKELGITVDESSMSFGNIVNAISVMQKSLGIAGTTSDEASKTISGSVNAMKSAWQNLLTGIADDNADFEGLVENFVDSVVTVGSNIIPRVKTIMGGLGKLISESAKKLVPLVVSTIVDNLPQIIESGVSLVVSLITGLIAAIPQLVQSIPQIIKAIINGFISSWPQLRQAGIDLLNMVGNGIKSLLSTVVSWGRNIIQSVKDGVMQKINDAKNWGREMINNFIGGLLEKWEALKSRVGNIASGIAGFFKHSIPNEGPFKRDDLWGAHMIENFTSGMMKEAPKLYSAADSIAGSVRDSMNFGGAASYSVSKGFRSFDGGLAGEIAALRKEVRNMKIYLDTGVLVGAVDSGLQTRAMVNARRALA